ncbi:hypothetical protein RHMOL_Rhmol10G0183100 [Rhododendron molle]|uniref:Uncharacterized protein n=1 Tax=Rhododendron molle TaxID=49168 RepID=A0ACC0M574_RHOML|nr:hypothetical protein RHMOL_Rhmol10G0183100 [Rhododendron molle]
MLKWCNVRSDLKVRRQTLKPPGKRQPKVPVDLFEPNHLATTTDPTLPNRLTRSKQPTL